MFESIKKMFGGSSANIKQLAENGAVIVDVRTPFEFKSGHLPGSRNIPLDALPNKIGELKKLKKTIITVCRSGSRSIAAKNILTSAGLGVCDGGAWTNFRV